MQNEGKNKKHLYGFLSNKQAGKGSIIGSDALHCNFWNWRGDGGGNILPAACPCHVIPCRCTPEANLQHGRDVPTAKRQSRDDSWMRWALCTHTPAIFLSFTQTPREAVVNAGEFFDLAPAVGSLNPENLPHSSEAHSASSKHTVYFSQGQGRRHKLGHSLGEQDPQGPNRPIRFWICLLPYG